jgi:hypothetical protein
MKKQKMFYWPYVHRYCGKCRKSQNSLLQTARQLTTDELLCTAGVVLCVRLAQAPSDSDESPSFLKIYYKGNIASLRITK